MKLFNVKPEYYDRIIEFLSAYEETCVSLMSQVLKKELNVYALAEVENDVLDIVGVFSISSSDSVQHCLPFASNISIKGKLKCGQAMNLLAPFFANKNIFCISGESKGTIFIQNAIRLAKKINPSETHAYYRMEYDKSRDIYSKQDALDDEKSRTRELKSYRTELYDLPFEEDEEAEIKNPVSVVKCSMDDFDALYPMWLTYQKVEVLLKGMELDTHSCKMQLARRLRTQDICGGMIENKFVSMAGTNSRGLNWVQIGGVFTLPLYRKLGIAGRLVSNIARNAVYENKNVTLFVKEINTKAIHSYERCGFVRKGNYRIVYYY